MTPSSSILPENGLDFINQGVNVDPLAKKWEISINLSYNALIALSQGEGCPCFFRVARETTLAKVRALPT